MKLYIKLENNQPINHPMFEENILECYPGIDLNNTDLFAPFIRLSPPDIQLGIYDVLDVKYVLLEDKLSYTDSFFVRTMSSEEIIEMKFEVTEKVKNKKQYLIGLVDEYINNEAAAIDIHIFNEYKNSLLLISQDAIETDPFSIKFPQPPIQDKSGNWLSTNNPGSTPNVIG